MDTSVIIQENLRAIRAAGVGLVIDDFGIGYLHLENLKTIAATKIKLDRAFVTVLPHDRRAFAAVQALTALGKELGIEVIAKGVENQAQQDALRAAGILRCQGYLHAPPMSETELLEWLQPGWTS